MGMTLEQELRARIFLHKVAITGGVLTSEYLQSQSNGAVKLPRFQVEEQADEYSNDIIKKALEKGTFDALYEKAWAKIADKIPDDTNLINV